MGDQIRCPSCNYTSTDVDKMVEHRMRHERQKAATRSAPKASTGEHLKCLICGFRHHDPDVMKVHRDAQHGGRSMPSKPAATPKRRKDMSRKEKKAEDLREAELRRKRRESLTPEEARAEDRAKLIGALVLVAIIGGCVLLANNVDTDSGGRRSGGGGGASQEPSSETLRHSAFEVCKDFVSDRLRSPGSATFRNYFEEDGEVRVTGSGNGPYTVRSTVDAENAFGASLRSSFTCEVRHTGDGNWRLLDITITER